jgi:hypothetical protein
MAEAIPRLRSGSEYVLVVIGESALSQSWPSALTRLQEAWRRSGCPFAPFFLCISTRRLEPTTALAIERKGARYMYTNDELGSVVEMVDLLLAEFRETASSGPHFRITHRFREPGTDCAPGEEVAAAYLVYRSREFFIPLPTTLLLLFDFLARHSRFPQSAAQIIAAIHADPFYRRHGENAIRGNLAPTFGRSSVKEFIKRIRRGLERSFFEAGLGLDPRRVLVSQGTVTNCVGYRLKATVEWVHFDHAGMRSE